MKQRFIASALFALLAVLAAAPSHAQAPATVRMCFGTGTPCPPVASGNPLPVTGTISATLGGFTPSAAGARGTPLTVTTSDSSGTLPSGVVVVVSNVGANPMYCNVNGVAATVSDQEITSGGGWFAFTIPAAITTLHCIATGGSTTANSLGGAGLATGTGGGSGGGGGGSVTQGTDPWLVAGKGTAGAASGGVVTVQGVASMTPFLTTTTLNAETTKVIGTVNQGTSPWVVSGTVTATPTGTQAVSAAIGTYAAGALTAGAFATGAGVDGWDLTQGAKADSVCATATGTCSVVALLKYLNNAVNSPPPLNVNAVNTAWTGLTPGVAQTGTIIAANMDLSSVAGIALGAMANYGTSPGAVKVQGVNAFITNTVPVTLTSTTITGTVAATQSGTWTVQPGNTANTTAWLMGLNTTPTIANGNGTVPTQAGAVLSATNPSFTRLTDATNAQVFDPCQTQAKSYAPINISTITTTRILTEVSAKKLYVCSIHIVTNAANNVALFEGTGASCAGGTPAGLAGGLTAASGWNFSANGGISLGNGASSVFANGTNAYSMCLITSATTQLSGSVSYVSQ